MTSTQRKRKPKSLELPAAAMDDVGKWDNRELGAEEAYVRKSPGSRAAVDKALNLESISIRLSKTLIDQYKAASGVLGVGYQPLMRDALERMAKTYLEEARKQIAAMEATAAKVVSRDSLKKAA